MIRLSVGDWSAGVAPERGGALLDLSWRGRPILRPTPEGATEMLDTACFPLVPYANRIADAAFGFEGRSVRLPVLERFAPHALHGDGWLHPWTLEADDKYSARMSLDWPGADDGWPWPWRAVQTVSLSEDGLRVDLSLTNTGDAIMPAGLGLHPYFHRPADAHLTLAATGVWLTDAREIPERLADATAVADWSAGMAVAGAPFVDHAYAGWDGWALIEGEGRHVRLSAEGGGWAQVYAPPGADFLCIEPVSHRPDAVHAPPDEASGLVRLQPGASIRLSMTATVET